MFTFVLNKSKGSWIQHADCCESWSDKWYYFSVECLLVPWQQCSVITVSEKVLHWIPAKINICFELKIVVAHIAEYVITIKKIHQTISSPNLWYMLFLCKFYSVKKHHWFPSTSYKARKNPTSSCLCSLSSSSFNHHKLSKRCAIFDRSK